MRSEGLMLELMTRIAEENNLIRAAYMEGSRVNPSIPKDIFQNYDIIYIVTTTKPFQDNKQWIEQFGDIMYMQYPEYNVFYPADKENCFGWLIQFTDGID